MPAASVHENAAGLGIDVEIVGRNPLTEQEAAPTQDTLVRLDCNCVL
jgi:hypothetical protein